MEILRAKKSKDNLEEEKETWKIYTYSRRIKMYYKSDGIPLSAPFCSTCLYGSEGWDGEYGKHRGPSARPCFLSVV